MADAPDKPDGSAKPDWRDTVFLPRTGFPMKAGLPQKEPQILARWQSEDLYGQVRRARAGRAQFILHDGPPYANGDIHIGHALNHVLKDMVVRTQTLLGKDAPYVPGWDCHGLPIEWKVEEQYRKRKRNKDEVPPAEFRAECRACAQHWVDTQREQLKRLGIGGAWDRPYLTMDYAAEATIVAELLKFAESGQLYRGAKPVMWSPVEKTALAEAEVEYEEIVSTQVYVAFEITESPIEALKGAYAVVWTTTPWTIPVNQAIAYGSDIAYRLAYHGGRRFLVAEDLYQKFLVDVGEWPTIDEILNSGSTEHAEVDVDEILATLEDPSPILGAHLVGTIARHPIYSFLRHSRESGNPDFLARLGPRFRGDDGLIDDEAWERALAFYAKPRPFLPGEFVTTEQGTGLVHLAPDHGEDDFTLCKEHGIDPVFAVEADGKYRPDWAWLGGQGSVINPRFNAPDGQICSDLREAGGLLAASADFKHSYPHSWRSKAKVIFRCTPQWFIAMDAPIRTAGSSPEAGAPLSPSPLAGEGQRSGAEQGEGLSGASPPTTGPLPGPLPQAGEGETLRQLALAAIAATRFVPDKGRNRIGSMVEGRPDWVISRQRAWGVPITLFVDRRSGHYLVDPAVNARIVAAIRDQGVDAWIPEAAAAFLGPDRNPDDYEMVGDILDVWFDSGCTHAFVLASGRWPELRWPADLYLEGSDQHRGWFQSSLLESCGTRGRAPYQAVLTHGFTMDAKGMKMSKSLGNTVSPIDLMREYGADILRLWALSVDFTEDHRIGKEILAGVADQYRKLRNTLRYLLGALDGFTEAERVADPAAMPELERYVLHLTAELDGRLRQAVADFDFNSYTRLLAEFANNDLSAFYFDIRKDCLYCDSPADLKRRACRTVLDTLFHALVRWLAPVLVFTAEEAWGTRFPEAGSVHLLEWPEIGGWLDPELAGRWFRIRGYRSVVLNSIEPLRRNKEIGSGLEADIWLAIPFEEQAIAQTCPLSEVFISSGVTLVDWPEGDDRSMLPEAVKLHFLLSVPFAASGARTTSNHKCGRCWRHLPEVADDGDLCARCDRVVHG